MNLRQGGSHLSRKVSDRACNCPSGVLGSALGSEVGMGVEDCGGYAGAGCGEVPLVREGSRRMGLSSGSGLGLGRGCRSVAVAEGT